MSNRKPVGHPLKQRSNTLFISVCCFLCILFIIVFIFCVRKLDKYKEKMSEMRKVFKFELELIKHQHDKLRVSTPCSLVPMLGRGIRGWAR